MTDQPDDQLLAAYAATGSHEPFAEIVSRHVDLVYAAARRQVRDAHSAEDVTQSVFLLLARKARTVPRGALVGWLLKTARYASFNAAKLDARRRAREAEAAAAAAARSPVSPSPDEEVPMHDRVAALLDDGLARLGQLDRSAVAMRYLQGKTTRDVAAALGVSEPAAQRRISRAIGKLRASFARRGVDTTSEALSMVLAGQAAHLAPVALAHAATTAALAGTAATGASAMPELIARATARALVKVQLQSVAAVCAAVVVAACGAVVVVAQLNLAPVLAAAPPAQVAPVVAAAASFAPPAAPTTAPAPPPVAVPATGKLSNSLLKLSVNAREFSSAPDPAVIRVAGGEPATLLQNIPLHPKSFGGEKISVDAAPFRGKRVRVSAYLRTQDVEGWAGLSINVFGPHRRVYAADYSADRPIHGDTEWRQYSSVVDVAPDSETISLGVALWSAGKVWADGFEITPVGADVATTDDRNWQPRAGSKAYLSSAAADPNVRRGGHPTTRFSFTAPGVNDSAAYASADGHGEQAVGKRIRLTGWLKCEEVAGQAGLVIFVQGANFTQLADEGERNRRPLRGTMDWQRYTATCDVPAGAQAIFTGVGMRGRGRIWMDDVQVEVIDRPAAAPAALPATQ